MLQQHTTASDMQLQLDVAEQSYVLQQQAYCTVGCKTGHDDDVIP
jgi:hypothetical protein